MEKFQKNLVVWKLSARARNGKQKIQVSEELSSVETRFRISMSLRGFHWFQKNLVVWKLPEMPQRLSGEEYVSEELSSVETPIEITFWITVL